MFSADEPLSDVRVRQEAQASDDPAETLGQGVRQIGDWQDELVTRHWDDFESGFQPKEMVPGREPSQRVGPKIDVP
jgi:hypothetical protein